MYKWIKKATWIPLESAIGFMTARASAHTDWLDDGSKYVNIRFDSRTGQCLICHDKDPYLFWNPDYSRTI